MKLCMVVELRCVVVHVKCDPNRSRGYGAVGSKMAISYYFGQWLIQQLVTEELTAETRPHERQKIAIHVRKLNNNFIKLVSQ